MIGTEQYSRDLRDRSVDRNEQRLLIARLAGSEQEPDLSEPVNCGGLGRIRHFGRPTEPPWPPNTLPAAPARSRLASLHSGGELRAQVFQNSACNWRCWYCYVPFALLGAHQGQSEWRTAGELVDAWQAEPDAPLVLDLSGGQPDLVPEWVPWTMRALADRGLDARTYLWSDDNLSTDYFWRYLSDDDIALVGSYRNYGRAVCFKGIDEDSFELNTAAAPSGYGAQFDYAARLLATGMDLYCYVTLTTESETASIPGLVEGFVDQLQQIDENLPLRTVPLEVSVFGPVRARVRNRQAVALDRQVLAVEAWNHQIALRFTDDQRAVPVSEVAIGPRP